MFKKILLTIGIALMSSPAFAGVTCTQNTGPGKPTVEFTDAGEGYYLISMYGHSRSAYRAVYYAPPSQFLSKSLVKVADESTHEDMPTQLKLRYADVTHTDIGFTYTLYGLLPNSIEFNEFKNCSL